MQNLITQILSQLGENPNREGLLKTPERVEKSLKFLTSGYNQNPAEIINEAIFSTTNSEMVLVRDIEFYSLCEHHLLPFFGRAHVAYIPDKKVVGLSKIPRLVECFARRLQIQEQLSEQIATALSDALKPRGVAVCIEAEHMCMQMRGVQKTASRTTTSALRGIFLSDERTRSEFYALLRQK